MHTCAWQGGGETMSPQTSTAALIPPAEILKEPVIDLSDMRAFVFRYVWGSKAVREIAANFGLVF